MTLKDIVNTLQKLIKQKPKLVGGIAAILILVGGIGLTQKSHTQSQQIETPQSQPSESTSDLGTVPKSNDNSEPLKPDSKSGSHAYTGKYMLDTDGKETTTVDPSYHE
ncbi:hypothetical protein [Leuconostoc inhae]|uniref:hypothetical protein n=1 Tax=Leuconostoc inhae TaxID=178001 RepID=UPI001C7CE616|nr:hypothetical protein [Leuconostoc inhae]